MNTHRKDQTKGADLWSRSRSAVTRAVGLMCVSLPDYQGIPTYPIMQAWKGNRLFGRANHGT
jgi:hypothetical protein